MQTNPIKYSDLVKPDDAITQLIEQLTALNTKYEESINLIKSNAAKMTASLKSTSGATEEGRKKTSEAAAAADKLAKAQAKLRTAQSATAKELAKAKLAQAEANRINKLTIKLNKSQEGSYNRLSAQYALNKIRLNQMTAAQRATTAAGKKLETETKAMYEEMTRLQKATGKSQLAVGQYERGIGKVASQFTMMPGVMGRVAMSFTQITMAAKAFIATPIGVALAAIVGVGATMKKLITTSSDFAVEMSKVKAITLATAEDMDLLSESSINLGRQTLKTANEVAGLQVEFAKLGFSTKEILDATAATISLSVASGAELSEAATTAASTIRGFGLEASDTQRIVDVMAKSFSSTALDMSKFTIAMPKVAAVAKASGDSVEVTTAKLGLLTNAGLEASIAGTSLRNVYLNLTKKGLTYNEAMDMINNSTDQAATSLELFGKRGAVTGIILANNRDAVDDLATSLDDADGAAQDMADTMSDNLQGDVTLLKSAWDGLFLTMDDGKGVITSVSRLFVQKVEDMVSSLTDFIADSKKNYNDLVQRSKGVITAIALIGKSVKITFSNINNLFHALVNTAEGVAVIMGNVLSGHWKDIDDNYERFNNLINQNFKNIKDNVKSLKDVLNGSVAEEYMAKHINLTKEQTEEEQKLEEERKKAAIEEKKRKEQELKDAQDAANAAIKAREEEDKKAAELAKAEKARKAQAAADEKKRQQDILTTLSVEKEAIQLKLAAVKEGSDEEMKLNEQLIENERKTALAKNSFKPEDQQQDTGDINAKYDTQQGDLSDKYLSAQLAQFDQQQDLAQSEFDLLKTTEEQKTEFKLKAERDRWQKILEINEKANTKLSDTEVQTIQNTIAQINGELANAGSKDKNDDGEPKDIYDMLGIKMSDNAKEAVNTSVQYAMSAVSDLAQSKVDAANAAVTSADKEVASAEAALQAQITARNAGYASDVAGAQKDLALAKKTQEEATKDQEKAQKQQAAIQTIQQASNLVTASAKIWGQLGFPWAIPAIATMWGSFALSKIKARQATKQSYGEGHVELLSGGSHQSGNDIDLGTKKDGTKRRAEGGEFFAVINKRNSRKFSSIIPKVVHSLNDGSFVNKYMNANKTEGLSINIASNNTNLTSLENDVNAIKRQNERKYYTDNKGNVVEVYKNIIKKTRS